MASMNGQTSGRASLEIADINKITFSEFVYQFSLAQNVNGHHFEHFAAKCFRSIFKIQNRCLLSFYENRFKPCLNVNAHMSYELNENVNIYSFRYEKMRIGCRWDREAFAERGKETESYRIILQQFDFAANKIP